MKLCGIDYPIKMSLGAIKQFKQKTGLDLWGLLLSFVDTYNKTSKNTTLERMKDLYNVCDFETASYAFHALIEKNHKASIEDIQDGMFRVGWLPTERKGDLTEPWPLVMVVAAFEIDSQFSEIDSPKKKADISEELKAE